MAKKAQLSKESQQEALRIAKGNQRPGQTKEQTKIIAQGIEKGIAEYKKKEKAKARERDKYRKKQLKEASTLADETAAVPDKASEKILFWLPWFLLVMTYGYLFATSFT